MYECPCGYVYDPAVGDPDGGIAPGTAFEDIPEDWVCPICGLGKDAFVECLRSDRLDNGVGHRLSGSFLAGIVGSVAELIDEPLKHLAEIDKAEL